MDNKATVFEFLYKNSDRQYNINQIAKLTKISVGSAFKVLKEFESGSYVSALKVKNAICYRANLNSQTRDYYFSVLQNSQKGHRKKTKIVGTIGPASNEPRLIKRLIDAGVDCVRINASHCTEASALDLIRRIRDADENTPILLDIPGPKFRLNSLREPLQVNEGDILRFTFGKADGDSLVLDRPLDRAVKKDHRILIDDGKIELVVIKASSHELRCKALTNGTITRGKGVNFPDSQVQYGDLSGKDKLWIQFALKHDIDFIGLSFVTSSEDIRKLNRQLGYESLEEVIGDKIKVIAKIETKEALSHYREIIREAYGIMIDRGDLASETKFEIVPRLQKKIIEEANRQGKPVIIATQMLDSMVEHGQPTKAEISDIANSVLDGASCLMLSAETAAGKYPLESVKTMTKVIKEIEGEIAPKKFEGDQDASFTACIANAITEIDKSLHIDALVVITSGGYTARMIASRGLRPKVVAVTRSKKVARQMQAFWGVTPLLLETGGKDAASTLDEKRQALVTAVNKGLINKTDRIILVASVLPHRKKRANLLEIHEMEEFLAYVDK